MSECVLIVIVSFFGINKLTPLFHSFAAQPELDFTNLEDKTEFLGDKVGNLPKSKCRCCMIYEYNINLISLSCDVVRLIKRVQGFS